MQCRQLFWKCFILHDLRQTQNVAILIVHSISIDSTVTKDKTYRMVCAWLPQMQACCNIAEVKDSCKQTQPSRRPSVHLLSSRIACHHQLCQASVNCHVPHHEQPSPLASILRLLRQCCTCHGGSTPNSHVTCIACHCQILDSMVYYRSLLGTSNCCQRCSLFFLLLFQ